MIQRIYIVTKKDYKMQVVISDKETRHYYTSCNGVYKWAKENRVYKCFKDYQEAIEYREQLIKKAIQNAENTIQFAYQSLNIDYTNLQTVER